MKLKEIIEKYNIPKSDFEIWLYNSLPKEYSSQISYGAFGAVTIDNDSVPKIIDAYKNERRQQQEQERKVQEQEAIAKQMQQIKLAEKQRLIRSIIITTGDLKREYEIVTPVYFQVSNKGVLSSSLSELKNKYISDIAEMKRNGSMSEQRADWGGLLLGEWSVGQNDFDAAFYIATQELKKRAAIAGADAVICMRQDIDIDTNGFAYFYLQMYGTAVRFIDKSTTRE